MKKFALYPIGLLVLLALTTCKKYKYETTYSGTVVDATTGAPLSGATVLLGHNVGSFSGSDYETVATQVSDSQGKFNFEFMAEKTGDYILIAKNVNWYFDNAVSDGVTVKIGHAGNSANKNLQVKMKPIGVLKLQINKMNNSYYYLDARTELGYTSCGAVGVTVNQTCISNEIDGGKNLQFSVEVKKYDSSYTLLSDQTMTYQTFIKVKDTTYYTLNY